MFDMMQVLIKLSGGIEMVIPVMECCIVLVRASEGTSEKVNKITFCRKNVRNDNVL